MSRPNEFDRLDTAERPAGAPDRFQKFKGDMRTLAEYREAYHAARAANSDSVAGLPDPDGDPGSFDVAGALASLKGLGGGLKADPAVNLRT